jgi:hypothetical protein
VLETGTLSASALYASCIVSICADLYGLLFLRASCVYALLILSAVSRRKPVSGKTRYMKPKCDLASQMAPCKPCITCIKHCATCVHYIHIILAPYAYPHQCVYATYLRYTRLRATCVFVVHEQALHELPRFMHISQCALSRHFIFLCASCILHPKHMLDLYGLLFLRRNVYLLHRSAPYIPSTQLFLRATCVSPLQKRAFQGLPRFMPLYLCALSRHFIFLCALCILHRKHMRRPLRSAVSPRFMRFCST